MKHLSLCGLMGVVAAGVSLPREALECTAERLSRTGQDVHHARIFYRDHMWRLEYNEPGAVTGGLVGALISINIPETAAIHYKQAVHRGDVLITVITDGEPRKIQNLLTSAEAGTDVQSKPPG